MFELGQKVLFSTSSNEKLKINLGIVIDLKDNKYIVLSRSYVSNAVHLLEEKYIDNLNNMEKVRQDIVDYYNSQIEEFRSRIKKVTSEEKRQERLDKYNDIKGRIFKNCERILACKDDDEFENRLKETNNLKKQLHIIDLECGDIIRKENGKIKYEIRNIERRLNSSLDGLSEETISKAFTYR